MRDDFKDTSTSANAEVNLNQKANGIIAKDRFSTFKKHVIIENTLEKHEDIKVVDMGILTLGQLNGYVSPSGTGKTTLAFALCNELLANKEVEHVFYIDKDNGLATTKNKILKLLEAHGDRFMCINSTETSDEDINKIIADLAEMDLSDTLIILDSLVNFIGDTKEEKHIKPFMEKLKKLRSQGATVLFLHHTRKQSKDNESIVYIGSTAIKSQADSMIYLEQVGDDEEYLTLKCTWDKMRANVEEKIISLKIDKELLTIEEIDSKKLSEQLKEKKDRFVIDAIKATLRRNDGEMSKTDLRKEAFEFSRENHQYPIPKRKIEQIVNNSEYANKHWIINVADKNKHSFKIIENQFSEKNK